MTFTLVFRARRYGSLHFPAVVPYRDNLLRVENVVQWIAVEHNQIGPALPDHIQCRFRVPGPDHQIALAAETDAQESKDRA